MGKIRALSDTVSELQQIRLMTVKEYTLDSEIDVGPMFIKFGFFPGPTTLLKRGKVLFSAICK